MDVRSEEVKGKDSARSTYRYNDARQLRIWVENKGIVALEGSTRPRLVEFLYMVCRERLIQLNGPHDTNATRTGESVEINGPDTRSGGTSLCVRYRVRVQCTHAILGTLENLCRSILLPSLYYHTMCVPV